MHKVTVYLKPADPYGVRAKTLLERKGVLLEVKPLPPEEKESYVVIGTWRGTYEELGSLDLKGQLDRLLQQRQP